MNKILVFFALLFSSILALAEEGKKADISQDKATQDLYKELATSIVQNFKDEESLKKSLEEGQREPAEFYDKLTPDQQKKIKELSEKLNPDAK